MSTNTAPTGLSRRELWVDARDLQSGEEGSEDQLTPEEYAAALTTRGREKLAEKQLVQSFSAGVRMEGAAFAYGQDYHLGDTITVTDRQLGVTVEAVVTGAEYADTADGQSMNLTLGYSQPTLPQIIARKEDK